jgi:ribulose 1,5-bisphosphate carboxylase large subunit-like protein
VAGTPVREAAKDSEELAVAIDRWGVL